jgi:PAS domain S-box-containing protein
MPANFQHQILNGTPSQTELSLKFAQFALDNCADGIALIRPDASFVYGNQAMCRMSGYTIEELCSLYVWDISKMESVSRQGWLHHWQMLKTHRQLSLETEHRGKDGLYYPVELSLNYFEFDGEEYNFVQVRNITERQRTERALQFTQFAVDNCADGIAWVRVDGSFAYANRSICRMLGYSLEELCSLHVWDIDDDISPSGWQSHWRKVKMTGGFSVETEHRGKNGRCYPVEISLNYFEFDGEGYNCAQVRDITNRKQAEATLRQSEERYQQLADNLPGIIYQFRVAPDGSINYPYISSGSWELFQLTPAEIVADSQCAIDLIHPDDLAYFKQVIAESARNLTPKLWEGRTLLRSGEIKWIKSASQPILQPDGSIVWDGMMLDITSQKVAQQERQRQENALQAIVAWTAAGTKDLDLYRACTQYLAKSLDVSYAFIARSIDDSHHKAEMISLWTGTEFIPPYEMDLIDTPCLVTYQQNWGIFPQDLQVHFPTATALATLGGESYLSLTIRDFEGNILGNIGIIDTKPLPSDIATFQFMLQLFADRVGAEMQRQCDEDELRKSQQQMKGFIDNSPAVMYLKDIAGNYLLVNQTFVNLSGVDASSFLGKNDTAIFPPAVAQMILDREQAIIQSGNAVTLEEDIMHLDGTVHTYLSNKFVLTDVDRQPYAIGGVSTDITDRKQTEIVLNQTNERLELTIQELQKATRLKDEFLATMSHELRTPLNAILGMSEALLEEVYGNINERQLNAVNTIEQSGKHLLSLIDDILDLSKISAGKVTLNITSISVAELCRSSLIFVSQQAHIKKIKIETILSSDIDVTSIDERRMRQVLINLLNNAIKFTPTGGKVTLSVSRANADLCPRKMNDCLCLSISDTGIGIASEDLSKLFQPFIQLDSNLNRKYEGTGLGLVMVKQIVELHGGLVTIDSELGKGSCFSIVLPHSHQCSTEDTNYTIDN